MVSGKIEWLGTLCIVLALFCTIQLFFTGVLAIAIPDILSLTGTHITTVVGLMAGLVVLPTAFRIKIVQLSPNMTKIYGYTLCYQKLAVGISSSLHFTGAVLSLVATVVNSFGQDFFQIMKLYGLKSSSKVLVDNIQWALHCCGASSYRDWFSLDWKNSDFNIIDKNKKPSFHELLSEETDNYPDLITIRNDAVPFSCCSKLVLSPCIHSDLERLGTNTINVSGCYSRIRNASNWILWIELTLCVTCFLIEVAILVLINQTPEMETKSVKLKSTASLRSSHWESFLNAEITPSSQSQVTLH